MSSTVEWSVFGGSITTGEVAAQGLPVSPGVITAIQEELQ